MKPSAAIASVACPACHAPAGKACRSRTGKIADTHAARVAAAAAALRQAGATGPLRFTPMRGTMREQLFWSGRRDCR